MSTTTVHRGGGGANRALSNLAALTLPDGYLKFGSHVLSEDTTTDDDGFSIVGTMHLVKHVGGIGGNVCMQEGTEPDTHASGDRHRIWIDTDHDILWQDHLGVSSVIHHAGNAGRWVLDGDDISYSAGDVTIGGTGGIAYDPGSDINCGVFTVDVTPGPAGAPTWQFLFNWDGWSTNRKMNISQGGAGLFMHFADGIDNWTLNNARGTPEGVVAADIGSLAMDTTNGRAYVKKSDSVTTGWELLADKEYADFKSILAQNVQNTGLTSGVVLTKASDATLDISAGTGYVTDYSDPSDPVTVFIDYAGVSGYTPVNLATNGLFVVGIDANGDIVEFDVQAVSTEDGRDNMLIGVYIAIGGVVDRALPVPFNLGYNTAVTAIDFIRDVIGPANVMGNLIFANGANLSLDTTGGTVFIIASNFRNDPKIPDELTIPSGSPISFYRMFRQASPSTQLGQDGPLTTFTNPDKWDDGSGILADVSVNDFTVQVVYATPGPHYVVYGQEVFNTMSNAETALQDGTLAFDEYPTLQALVQRSFLIVRQGTTDLSDSSDAKFFDAGKFRLGGISTSGGIPGINIPGGSNMSIQYNDNGVFGGNGDLTWDDTSKILILGATSSMDTPEIVNSVGILKLQPDVAGNVELFGDAEVGDAEVGKILYVRRQAAEGDDYVRLYVNHDTTGVISASSNLTAYGEDSVTLHSGAKDVIFRVGDDVGVKKTYFKNSSNAIVGSVDSLGNAQFNVSVDTPEIVNSAGILKLQPDADGNVELFGDTDVGDAESGKMFYVRRRAAEGNDYMRFYISATEKGFIHTSCPMTLQAQVEFTINSVTDDIIFKVGDNAGAKKVYFKDGDGSVIAWIDSDGNAQFEGAMAIGITTPASILHLAAQGPVLTLDNTRTIMGMGYNVGAIDFLAGEPARQPVALIRVTATEDWTATSSPTRMEFSTTPVGSLTRDVRVTIDPGGRVTIGNDLQVDGAINHDGSTVGFYGTTPVAQPAHITDADGTLSDLTTKFNALLAQAAALGLQVAA